MQGIDQTRQQNSGRPVFSFSTKNEVLCKKTREMRRLWAFSEAITACLRCDIDRLPSFINVAHTAALTLDITSDGYWPMVNLLHMHNPDLTAHLFAVKNWIDGRLVALVSGK